MKKSLKSTPPRSRPIGGITTSFTSEVTMPPNAAPMITPIARSTTLPRMMNVLNSLSMGLPSYAGSWRNSRVGGCAGDEIAHRGALLSDSECAHSTTVGWGHARAPVIQGLDERCVSARALGGASLQIGGCGRRRHGPHGRGRLDVSLRRGPVNQLLGNEPEWKPEDDHVPDQVGQCHRPSSLAVLRSRGRASAGSRGNTVLCRWPAPAFRVDCPIRQGQPPDRFPGIL